MLTSSRLLFKSKIIIASIIGSSVICAYAYTLNQINFTKTKHGYICAKITKDSKYFPHLGAFLFSHLELFTWWSVIENNSLHKYIPNFVYNKNQICNLMLWASFHQKKELFDKFENQIKDPKIKYFVLEFGSFRNRPRIINYYDTYHKKFYEELRHTMAFDRFLTVGCINDYSIVDYYVKKFPDFIDINDFQYACVFGNNNVIEILRKNNPKLMNDYVLRSAKNILSETYMMELYLEDVLKNRYNCEINNHFSYMNFDEKYRNERIKMIDKISQVK